LGEKREEKIRLCRKRRNEKGTLRLLSGDLSDECSKFTGEKHVIERSEKGGLVRVSASLGPLRNLGQGEIKPRVTFNEGNGNSLVTEEGNF